MYLIKSAPKSDIYGKNASRLTPDRRVKRVNKRESHDDHERREKRRGLGG